MLNALPRASDDPLDRLIARSRPWYRGIVRGFRRRANLLAIVNRSYGWWSAPLVMARFHLLSPAAIVLGPLVALPVTLAMAAGFAVLGLGAIAADVGRRLRLGLQLEPGDWW